MPKLFYVIGASGAGKDSLLKYVREHVSSESSLMFAHRYITRPADVGGENHVALSSREFAERVRQACFSMHWESHGNFYGIGTEIDHWLERDLNVVVNGSRTYLPVAAEKYKNLVPILICANREKLFERLIKRGRENTQQVKKRLTASDTVADSLDHPLMVRIDNNNDLSQAGKALIEVLMDQKIKPKKSMKCV